MKTIGGYELLREIGSGQVGTVWQAKRSAVGGATKPAAVKLMPELAKEPRARELFIAEARLSMLLSFRNVVQVFDAGEQDGVCFLVMEWVDGLNLAQLTSLVRARGGSFDPVLSAYIVGELLRGLACAQSITHEGAPLGVVHRDLTPSTVLISVSGELKLTGFGLGLLTEEARRWELPPEKLRYKAPEQLRERNREPSADLYAVGAILHELLDRRPFRGEIAPADLHMSVIEGVVPDLQDPASIPPELDTLRRALLQADPTRRPPRAEDALELLMRWPGYRDASMELARLCRSYMGVAAPRSGVHARGSDT